eukprot:1193144-Prorocentrum_minimum.AAC.5
MAVKGDPEGVRRGSGRGPEWVRSGSGGGPEARCPPACGWIVHDCPPVALRARAPARASQHVSRGRARRGHATLLRAIMWMLRAIMW